MGPTYGRGMKRSRRTTTVTVQRVEGENCDQLYARAAEQMKKMQDTVVGQFEGWINGPDRITIIFEEDDTDEVG
jgi:hypothetical protein